MFVTFSNTNTVATGSLTMTINGLSIAASNAGDPIKAYYNDSISNLGSAGELQANETYLFAFDGTNWVCLTSNNGIFIAIYGQTSYAEVLAAYNANRIVYCKAGTGNTPAASSKPRMAFLAYANSSGNPANFEFQYYRSVDRNGDTNNTYVKQQDEIYVYKVTNSNGTIANQWSLTRRATAPRIKAGTGLAETYGTDNSTATLSSYAPSPAPTLTLSLNTEYGDSLNPYGSKTQHYVLAAPSDQNGIPDFRELVADDIPSLTLSKISDATDLAAIEALTETSGLLKKTAANTWELDVNTYVTSSGVTSISWDSTNKKLQQSIDSGTAQNILEFVATSPITVTGAENKLTIAHSTSAGYKHIPSGGSTNQYLKYSSSGTATWATITTSDISGYSSGVTNVSWDSTNGLQQSKNGATATQIVSPTTLREHLGLSNALHFIGISIGSMSDGVINDETISGVTSPVAGDVVLDKDSEYEFIWTGSKWERLGPDSSYKIVQSEVSDANATNDVNNTTTNVVSQVTQTIQGVITVKKVTLATGTGIALDSTTNQGTISIAAKTTLENPTSATNYYGLFSDSTDNSGVLKKNESVRFRILKGTTSATGLSRLALGNATASGITGNYEGELYLYSSGTKSHTIKGAASSTSDYTHTLPNSDGYLVSSGSINTAVGSSNKPIFISNTGVASECSTYAGGTKVTLNNTDSGANDVSFYAPTGSGTSGQFLKSGGDGIAPAWTALLETDIPTLSLSKISGAAVSWDSTNKAISQNSSSVVTQANLQSAIFVVSNTAPNDTSVIWLKPVSTS